MPSIAFRQHYSPTPHFLAQADNSDYIASGPTAEAAVADLARHLLTNGDDLLQFYTLTGLACAGLGAVETRHFLYGSPHCPEPWQDIECELCSGSGELELELEDLLSALR